MKTLANPHDTAEIARRLKTMAPDRRPRWGRMSAHQMVCHQADALRMATGDKHVSPVHNRLSRTAIKWIVLYAPAPWPPGIRTCRELDQEHGGTRPGEFAADLAEALALLERVASSAEGLDGRVHPIFGQMSGSAWLRWGYLHTDHHLRQFGV